MYELLRKPADLDRLRPFIEHCENCMAAFLRGFFDSEGSISEAGEIKVSNTDLELLRYIGRLLGRLGIETGEPRLMAPKGTPTYFPGRKKTYKKRRDCFIMLIRMHCNPTYHLRVGFTIKRKQERLEQYVRRRQATQPLSQFSLLFIP